MPQCIKACKLEAINFNQKHQELEINVGAIVLACGADEVKDDLSKYGYKKYPKVLPALELEALKKILMLNFQSFIRIFPLQAMPIRVSQNTR